MCKVFAETVFGVTVGMVELAIAYRIIEAGKDSKAIRELINRRLGGIIKD